MKIHKKTFNKILNYLSTEYQYLLDNTQVSYRHFKLLKHDATYNKEHYKIITFTQKVSTGVLLRHFIWMTEDEKSFFLVNTQQKFKLTSEERKWLSPDADYSSMYQSIGGGLSVSDENMKSLTRQAKYSEVNLIKKVKDSEDLLIQIKSL